MNPLVDHTADAASEQLKPVEALRRAFHFEAGREAGSTALSAAYGPAKAPAGTAVRLDLELQQREGFRIGHLGLMIRYEDGSELADLPTSYRLPNAPEWCVGIANLHGVLVPVFDLASYLGVEHQQGAKPMLLVLGHGADAAGVVIDGLPQRLKFSSSDRAEGAPIPAALEVCATHTYWASGHTWIDLQVDALLSKFSDELAAANQ